MFRPPMASFMLMYDSDDGSRLVMLTRCMKSDQDKQMVAGDHGDIRGWRLASTYWVTASSAPSVLKIFILSLMGYARRFESARAGENVTVLIRYEPITHSLVA